LMSLTGRGLKGMVGGMKGLVEEGEDDGDDGAFDVYASFS